MAAIIPIPAFADNYVWLLREGRAAVVVDPGDAAPVQAYLDREGLDLAAIVATHHHGDHVGGVEALVARRHVPVYGPARETIPARTRALREGDAVVLDELGLEFLVLDVPGHTAGHIAYTGRVADAPVLFCGDTLFAAGCGRIFEGTPATMWTSLRSSRRSIPPPGCSARTSTRSPTCASRPRLSPPTLRWRSAGHATRHCATEVSRPCRRRIADELATNPFLRAGEPAVRAAAEAHAGRRLDGEVAVFAELRAWKNGYR